MSVTKEGIEVKVGQVWRDLDKRFAERRVVVMKVEDGKAEVRNLGGSVLRTTKLSVHRMHKSSTGWALVSEPA